MDELKKWIAMLSKIDRLDKFYHSSIWKKIKREILVEQHYECQRCREKYHKLTLLKEYKKECSNSKYQLAYVHHLKEVKEFPQLALSKYYVNSHGQVKRQLLLLCPRCHNEVHNRFCNQKNKKLFTNLEKW